MAMTTSIEPGRVEYHFPLLKEGEVSPCKILVSILIREYFTHNEFKAVHPQNRIAVAFFMYRLISARDTSYKGFLALCLRHENIIAPEIIISFLRVIDNLDEENPCFLNELVVSIIDIVDTSQTIMLRKGVLKASPIGKFLRLVMLSIRKMSYPQVSYLYKQFWAYIQKDDLGCVRSQLQSILPQALTKGFQKLYVQQHQPFVKNQPRPGLDRFNELLCHRASTGRTGLGASLYGLPVPGKVISFGPAAARRKSLVVPTPQVNKKLVVAKWHGRKIIEKTLRNLCCKFYTTGVRRYTPRQISTFIEAIRHNPSSEPMYPQMHFLEYLNSIQLKDLSRCTDSLRTTFDLKRKPVGSELNKAYAAYNFALLYDFFGFREDAVTTLNEAFQASYACSDQKCLHYCNNLWSSMENVPYKGSIVKSQLTRRMHKSLSYMHSFNVTSVAFNLYAEGKSVSEVFKSIWRVTTGLDFENTESLVLIALANMFSMLGDNEAVGFVSEILLSTAHLIRWPLRSYASALVHFGSSSLMRADFSFTEELLQEYGENLFKCDGSVAGELFTKHNAICKATRSFLGRKLIAESVIATIHAFDTLESYYWNAYNHVVRKDWQKSERLISKLLDSVKVKSCENCDIIIRILILEAEINCANENPTGALQRLFEAHRLAVKLSADFYIMLCQLGISTIQVFLGLPSTAMKSLHSESTVKCRAACKFLRAKLCVLTAKLALHNLPDIPTTNKSGDNTEMEFAEVIELFKTNQTAEYKHKQPKISKKSKTPEVVVENDNNGHEKFVTKIQRLLEYADLTFQKFENDYLRYEVLCLKKELLNRIHDSIELETVENEISQSQYSSPSIWNTVCII